MTTPTDGNDISDEEDRAHDNAPQPQQTRLDYEKSLRVTPPTLAETAMTTPMRKLPATRFGRWELTVLRVRKIRTDVSTAYYLNDLN